MSNAVVVDELLSGSIKAWKGLDYGGGNGKTAGILSSWGYHYDCFDPFGTSTTLSDARGSYNFCSVFEVAEHTPFPRNFMEDLASWCHPDRAAILVGTSTHDYAVTDVSKLNWYYAAPRNGHVSLHSRDSLKRLAGEFGFNCLSFSEQTHLFTRGYSRSEARWFLVKGKLRGRLRRLLNFQSLLSRVHRATYVNKGVID
jgi:2-polyprenyl-6-hydroxyphenyl methylase/3-demethylubiquinone-9 3-methyltransferase